MKRKYHYLLVFIIIMFSYLGIFCFPKVMINSSINALLIFREKLFPSIFPFFVLSFLFINMGYPLILNKYFKNITRKIFHLSENTSFILLMSIISGFPSGAKYIVKDYSNNYITKEEGNQLLLFTHFANPLFVLGTCGILLNSKRLAYKILICQLLANIILGILVRPKEITISQKKEVVSTTTPSLISILPDAINETMEVLIFMLGSITIFQFFTNCFLLFTNESVFFKTIFTGIMDLTSGISLVPTLSISIELKALLMLIFITFGSLSVHLQVINAIKNTNLSYTNFFIGRILESVIAVILFTISII